MAVCTRVLGSINPQLFLSDSTWRRGQRRPVWELGFKWDFESCAWKTGAKQTWGSSRSCDQADARFGLFQVVQMQCNMELNEDKTQWHVSAQPHQDAMSSICSLHRGTAWSQFAAGPKGPALLFGAKEAQRRAKPTDPSATAVHDVFGHLLALLLSSLTHRASL